MNKLRTLWDDHAKAVYAYLLHLTRNEADASEFLSEVFSRLARRPELVETLTGEPRGYLLRLARNAVVDAVRRDQARDRALEKLSALDGEAFFKGEDPDNALLGRALAAALEQLPADQREVVHARLWKKQTLEVIAAGLGISINTAASRYRYGLDKMRGALRSLYEDLALNPSQKPPHAMNQQAGNPFSPLHAEEPIIQALEPRRVPSATGAVFAMPVLPTPDDHDDPVVEDVHVEDSVDHSLEVPLEVDHSADSEMVTFFDGDSSDVKLPVTFEEVVSHTGEDTAAGGEPDVVWALDKLASESNDSGDLIVFASKDGMINECPVGEDGGVMMTLGGKEGWTDECPVGEDGGVIMTLGGKEGWTDECPVGEGGEVLPVDGKEGWTDECPVGEDGAVIMTLGGKEGWTDECPVGEGGEVLPVDGKEGWTDECPDGEVTHDDPTTTVGDDGEMHYTEKEGWGNDDHAGEEVADHPEVIYTATGAPHSDGLAAESGPVEASHETVLNVSENAATPVFVEVSGHETTHVSAEDSHAVLDLTGLHNPGVSALEDSGHATIAIHLESAHPAVPATEFDASTEAADLHHDAVDQWVPVEALSAHAPATVAFENAPDVLTLHADGAAGDLHIAAGIDVTSPSAMQGGAVALGLTGSVLLTREGKTRKQEASE